MMRYNYLSFFVLFAFLLVNKNAIAQSACPSVSVTPQNSTICGGCTTLTAAVQGTATTTAYSVSTIPYTPFSYTAGTPVLVNKDDTFSAVITIPFCFDFYTNKYTQLVIGPNGITSFDLTLANTRCDYALCNSPSMPNPVPYPGLPNANLIKNSIMCPFQDTDPTKGGTITYQSYGTAPCRVFVVSWNAIPMYSFNCLGKSVTSQIALYETTNIIDVYIQNKDTCNKWNGALSILGIQNATGTLGTAAPGKNNTIWTATNEGYRFIPTGSPQYSLAWYEPSNPNPISTGLTVTVCPTSTTTYTATVTNNSCSGAIVVNDLATVNVASSFTVATSVNHVSCNGGNNGSATVSPSVPNPAYTYTWNNGQTTQTASGLTAGQYTISVADGSGCLLTNYVTITEPTPLVATTTQTNVSCNGNDGSATVTVSGGTPAYSYSWNNGQTTSAVTGLAAGSYTVAITDANACSSIQTFTLTGSGTGGFTVTATQVNGVLCNGVSNGSASASSTGGTAPYTYNWSTGQTTQTASGLAAGTYTVTVTDGSGCVGTNTVTITQPLALSFSSVTQNDTCNKKQGTASVIASGGTPPYTYLWLTSPVQSSPVATGLGAGSHTCIISDANGCAIINIPFVGNIPGPVADFTPDPSVTSMLDPNVICNNNSLSAVSWIWDFGDNSLGSTLTNPSHTYQSEGTYVITLIVRDGNGCIDSTQKVVVVEKFTTIYVPNTFTPNNDGKNDYFLPVCTGIDGSNYSMMIFDRWGNEVFKTTTVGDWWNGRMDGTGKLVQEDIYIYVITYTDMQKNQQKHIGNVNMLR